MKGRYEAECVGVRGVEVNMHYTLFPFPVPYHLLPYSKDYPVRSDPALFAVMAGCGEDSVLGFFSLQKNK